MQAQTRENPQQLLIQSGWIQVCGMYLPKTQGVAGKTMDFQMFPSSEAMIEEIDLAKQVPEAKQARELLHVCLIFASAPVI